MFTDFFKYNFKHFVVDKSFEIDLISKRVLASKRFYFYDSSFRRKKKIKKQNVVKVKFNFMVKPRFYV